MTPRKPGRFQIEVHPHAATVNLFGLDRIVKYKKGVRGKRANELRRLRKLMLTHLPILTPALSLRLPAVPKSGNLKPVPPVHRMPTDVEGRTILVGEDATIESSDPVHLRRAKERRVPQDFRASMAAALALAGFKVVTNANELSRGISEMLTVRGGCPLASTTRPRTR